eukprot:1602013-Alexandrium_andersonii.AAC.1
MSASLVGSEMCIRDRVSAGCSPEPVLVRKVEQVSDTEVSALRPKGCPVSYTHLTLPTICSV